jgi:hypothetical protein
MGVGERGPNPARAMRLRRGAGSVVGMLGMRGLIGPVALSGMCLLAGCGAGGSSGAAVRGGSAAAPGAVGLATPVAPAGASGAPAAVACLPVDTPVDQAPAAIGKVWRDRDVMIVPACSVFDVKLPAFVNLARSAGLSDAEAKRIAEARVRSEQMANWGLRTGQLSIADPLSPISLYTTPALDAVHAGYSVTSQPDTPGCATPIRLTTLSLSAGTVAGMDRSDPITAPGPVGLVVQYGPGDCAAIGTKNGEAKVVIPNDPTQVDLVLGGVVRHDAAIGIDYWYYVANGECGHSPIVTQACREAGY